MFLLKINQNARKNLLLFLNFFSFLSFWKKNEKLILKNQEEDESHNTPTLGFDCVPTVNPSERDVYYYLHENER